MDQTGVLPPPCGPPQVDQMPKSSVPWIHVNPALFAIPISAATKLVADYNSDQLLSLCAQGKNVELSSVAAIPSIQQLTDDFLICIIDFRPSRKRLQTPDASIDQRALLRLIREYFLDGSQYIVSINRIKVLGCIATDRTG